MRQFRLFRFLFLTMFIFPFFFPVAGAANHDPEDASITLNLTDTPTKDILKEIEKQSQYSIDILNLFESESLDDILSDKKSIVLDKAPLGQALQRLLKDFNYSVISNDKQKNLVLVLLKKNDSQSAMLTDNESYSSDNNSNSGANTLDGLEKAFEDYQAKKEKQELIALQGDQSDALTDQEIKISPFAELDAAFEDYEAKRDRQELTAIQGQQMDESVDREQKISPFAELDAAFEDYEAKKDSQELMAMQDSASQYEKISPFADLDAAFEDYEIKKSRNELTNMTE